MNKRIRIMVLFLNYVMNNLNSYKPYTIGIRFLEGAVHGLNFGGFSFGVFDQIEAV